MKKIIIFAFLLCFTFCFSQNKETGKEEAGIEINSLAIEIIQKDVNEKDVKLSSFKGNYVLVDFWASWCAPCRKEIPAFIAVYNNYHAKGFEVLGVSLDRKKEIWIEAIQKDAIPWVNVSDLKGWSNSAAKMYQVISLPQNILVNPEGKIIAKNMTAEELNYKLSEVYPKM